LRQRRRAARTLPQSDELTARSRSAPDEPIDADRDGGPDGERYEIHICDLTARIERGEQQQTGEASAERGRNHFEYHQTLPLRATMIVRQGPLASGTGRHEGVETCIKCAANVARSSCVLYLSTYHGRENWMRGHRLGSVVLLAGGVVLVFAGMSSAMGFTISGIISSLAAVVALLYAGGVWFGGASHGDPSIIVFTPQLTVAGGAFTGRRVADLFDAGMRGEIESACREALDGRPSRFFSGRGSTRRAFEAAPVRGADGLVIYGMLLSG